MSPRPRIAFVAGDLAPGELARLAPRFASEAEVDLVVVGPAVAGLVAFDGEPDASSTVTNVEAGNALVRAAELALRGKVDAIAGAFTGEDELAQLSGVAGVSVEDVRVALVRGQNRIVVLGTSGSLPTIEQELQEDRALRLLEVVSRGLSRELGLAKPTLAVCVLDPEARDGGAPGLVRACARARAAGLDASGPHAAETAFTTAADAVLALTRDQARLALSFPILQAWHAADAKAPIARLLLGLPFARTSEDPLARSRSDRDASLLASVVLAARVARARGELVQAKEQKAFEARRALVAVSARAPTTENRCPFCRRPFDDDEPAFRCARCETPHHRACFHEHGRCTVNGCGSVAVVRQGRELKAPQLAPGAGIVRSPLLAILGPAAAGDNAWLRVDAPVDDPDEPAPRREVALELAPGDVARGTLLEAALVVRAPKALRATGIALRVKATLETRGHGPDARPTVQPILEHEALVCGRLPTGMLGQLSDGVAALLGSEGLVSIPAGVRRYLFSLRLGRDHPASVRLTGTRGLEVVTTALEATLTLPSGGGLTATSEVGVV